MKQQERAEYTSCGGVVLCEENVAPCKVGEELDALLRELEPDVEGGILVNSKGPDYKKAARIAEAALAGPEKSVDVLIRYARCLAVLRGSEGIRQTLELVISFHQNAWDSMRPALEKIRKTGGEIRFAGAERGARTQQLANLIARCVLCLPVAHPADGEPITLQQVAGHEGISAAVARTPSSYYVSLRQEVASMLNCLESLAATIQGRYSTLEVIDEEEPPSFDNVRTALQSLQSRVAEIVGEDAEVGVRKLPSELPAQSVPPPTSDCAPLGDITTGAFSRAAALRNLSAIALGFETHEPHNPAGPMIRLAIRWAQKPLGEWLTEVISDESVLNNLKTRLGFLKLTTD